MDFIRCEARVSVHDFHFYLSNFDWYSWWGRNEWAL